ncbi:MAG: recombinase family protein [Solirubrobacteraceae bacterium]|jgi:DNA invertase Pin-like site-specific DNA recombinase
MSKALEETDQPNSEPEVAEAAAVYVRVSSTGQMGRDGDEDGYSIPAQVEACKKEAISRGAKVAKVYIERAESAKSDDRPVLQCMLRELPTLGVKYLIVHKVDRLARNRLDDATLYQKLVGMGIKLVSASENIDETPAGQLMHGMLATFAEYYSNNLATEVKKGLRRKHEQGGTPHKPPIGYLSKRELIGGQDIRSVIVDPERAPLIKLAFTLYATGEWTLRDLTAHLEEQGLRSCGTRRYPSRPMTVSGVHGLLHNRYYIGIVSWDGRRFPGKHDTLVDVDTFDKVQALLTAARVSGERPQRHEHYLRGTVVCAECLGRLLYGRHRGRTGDYYEYFACNNRTVRRRKVQCSSGHASVPVVEEGVLNLYRSVRLDPKIQEQIRTELRAELDDRAALVRMEAERHRRALKAIEAKQEKLVQLYYDDLVTLDVFEREQDKLKAERQAADRLENNANVQLEDIQAALELALSRVDRPQEVYSEGTEMERRVMNRAIFARIEIGPDADITATTLTPVYQALAAWQPKLGSPRRPAVPKPGQAGTADFRPLFAPAHFQNTCKRSKSKPITRLRRQGIVPCIVPQRSSGGRRTAGFLRSPHRERAWRACL